MPHTVNLAGPEDHKTKKERKNYELSTAQTILKALHSSRRTIEEIYPTGSEAERYKLTSSLLRRDFPSVITASRETPVYISRNNKEPEKELRTALATGQEGSCNGRRGGYL